MNRFTVSALRSSLLATSLASLLSCAVGPDYERPSLDLPDEFGSPADATAKFQDSLRWWESFGDPILDAVVMQVAAENLSIAQAAARLQEASARRSAATAALLPSLSATAGSQRFKLSGNGANPVAPLARAGIAQLTGEASQLGLQSSWEIDLFGRVRRGREAAIATERGAEADLQDVTLSAVAAAANAYIELRGVQRQRQIIERTIALEHAEVVLISSRVEFGLASVADLHGAESRRSVVAASLPLLVAAERELLGSVGVLMGLDVNRARELLDSSEARDSSAREWALAASVPAGLPAELLARRGDVRRAEQSLIAANAGVGVAQAARYPSFALTGNAGQEAVDFADIFASGSRNWAFNPLISLPLFTGGAVKAEVTAAEARRSAAEAQFRQAVLVALSEVEIQLTSYAQSQLRRRELAEAQASALAAAGATEVLRDEGLIDGIPLLAAQRVQLAREQDLIVSETETAQALVGLYRVLGGGW
jgi:multidrug efflux system outer membrane protein